MFIISSIVTSIINLIYTNLYDFYFGSPSFRLGTPLLFLHSLRKLRPASRVLDFGCGNGICYSNADVKKTVLTQGLQIVGIDIDVPYIERCKRRIDEEHLAENVHIMLQDVFDYRLDSEIERFDYILFSESAPLLSNDLLISMCRHMIEHLLKTDGKIIFINNLTEDSGNAMRVIKPYLKYVTMVEFGRVLTSQDFFDIAKSVKKKATIKLIDKLRVREILNFFRLEWMFLFFSMCFGITNYEVEQFEITLSNL